MPVQFYTPLPPHLFFSLMSFLYAKPSVVTVDCSYHLSRIIFFINALFYLDASAYYARVAGLHYGISHTDSGFEVLFPFSRGTNVIPSDNVFL